MTPPDTIVAISTPPGRGGIGIVRLSGTEAVAVAGKLLRVSQELSQARAVFARVLDESGGALDEALVTAFFAPQSYTGEDLVEIAAHGSPVVLEHMVRGALRHGARLAEPGEFSRRAFLSGRIDLTQAEAIHDLIAAQTLAQARTAAQQLGGALSRRVAPVKTQLVHLIALLEAGMDFASGELDDVDTVPQAQIADAIDAVRTPLVALAESFRAGSLQRNGARLALVGRPNAGKSSLFNRLLERERSIVTAVPGTTRDTIEEALALDGIPIRLVDTAGLRVAAVDGALDEAERLGIERSREALADADLVVLVEDATSAEAPLLEEDDALLRGRPMLRVRSKIDLVRERVVGGLATSAVTGEGVEALRAAVLAKLRGGAGVADDGALNSLRQHEAVRGAVVALESAAAANADGLPHEVLLMDLRVALDGLDALTGSTTTDDILGLIFSTFCIGK